VLPYVVWVIYMVAVVVIGLLNPASVSRRVFYCLVDKTGLITFQMVYSAICCIFSFILEGSVFITIDSPPPSLTIYPSTHRYRNLPYRKPGETEWFGHFPRPEGHHIWCSYSLWFRVRFPVFKMPQPPDIFPL
jgi:hypothetical protein